MLASPRLYHIKPHFGQSSCWIWARIEIQRDPEDPFLQRTPGVLKAYKLGENEALGIRKQEGSVVFPSLIQQFSGWWLSPTLLKNMSSSVGMMTSPISADPGLGQGRGGAWDHRRCGTSPSSLSKVKPISQPASCPKATSRKLFLACFVLQLRVPGIWT